MNPSRRQRCRRPHRHPRRRLGYPGIADIPGIAEFDGQLGRDLGLRHWGNLSSLGSLGGLGRLRNLGKLGSLGSLYRLRRLRRLRNLGNRSSLGGLRGLGGLGRLRDWSRRLGAVGALEDGEVEGPGGVCGDERVVDAVLVGVGERARLGRTLLRLVLGLQLAQTLHHVLHRLRVAVAVPQLLHRRRHERVLRVKRGNGETSRSWAAEGRWSGFLVRHCLMKSLNSGDQALSFLRCGGGRLGIRKIA